jgi:hypothetical protein
MHLKFGGVIKVRMKFEICYDDRPHPDPLPPGEGIAIIGLLFDLNLSGKSSRANIQK